MKVMAKIPLSACIASCIGRRRPFMHNDRHECEIMVCGAFVEEVMYVGMGRVEVPALKRKYFSKVGENLKRFSRQ